MYALWQVTRNLIQVELAFLNGEKGILYLGHNFEHFQGLRFCGGQELYPDPSNFGCELALINTLDVFFPILYICILTIHVENTS